MTIPRDLEDAGRIDGCNIFGNYFTSYPPGHFVLGSKSHKGGFDAQRFNSHRCGTMFRSCTWKPMMMSSISSVQNEGLDFVRI